MNETSCASVKEVLPELVDGTLREADVAAVERHLVACADCRSELELVRLLRRSRPAVPSGLAPRIQGAVRLRRDALTRPWWGLAAAVIAALAVGIGVVAERDGRTQPSVPAYASESAESDVWVSGDGLVAGAPVLNGLSDQALQELLKEMGQWKTGT